jgi:hypothetical protein
MAEDNMENNELASGKPDGAHTQQNRGRAWHTQNEWHLLQTQANN